MPALPAAVTAYLSAVKASLRDHPSDDPTVDVAPIQYIRAMHLSAALDLLQNALDQPANLTVVSGTTRTVTDGAATFVANSMIGNYVTFAGNVTAALAGKTYRVASNTATTLTMTEYMAAAPAAGDTYTIRAGFLDEVIAGLRAGKGLGDAGTADGYGDLRLVLDGLIRGIAQTGATLRERTLFSGVTAAGSSGVQVALNLRGGKLRADELRGMKLNLTGSNPMKIVANTEEGVCTVSVEPSGGAPVAGVAVSVAVPTTSDFMAGRDVHPGAHQSSYVLADLLDQFQAAVVAFTLPT